MGKAEARRACCRHPRPGPPRSAAVRQREPRPGLPFPSRATARTPAAPFLPPGGTEALTRLSGLMPPPTLSGDGQDHVARRLRASDLNGKPLLIHHTPEAVHAEIQERLRKAEAQRRVGAAVEEHRRQRRAARAARPSRLRRAARALRRAAAGILRLRDSKLPAPATTQPVFGPRRIEPERPTTGPRSTPPQPCCAPRDGAPERSSRSGTAAVVPANPPSQPCRVTTNRISSDG